jgi:hypothetical protein
MTTSKQYGPFEFQWTTKEGYLAWRKEWRAKYAALSKAIRDHRQVSRKWQSDSAKQANRGNKPAVATDYDKQLAKRYADAEKTFQDLGIRSWAASTAATIMLEERKASKAEAQRQWLANGVMVQPNVQSVNA